LSLCGHDKGKTEIVNINGEWRLFPSQITAVYTKQNNILSLTGVLYDYQS